MSVKLIKSDIDVDGEVIANGVKLPGGGAATDVFYTDGSNGALPSSSGLITTAVSIDSTTLTDLGKTQDRKLIGIENGASNINYTVNASLTTSYVRLGTGTLTFVQGAGRTLVAMDATLVCDGIVGSSMSIVSFGTTDYLYINNL